MQNNNREHPIDVMLIDWQTITRASPVHDLAPLFYTCATEEAIDNYKYYLEVYYKELSNSIKELGSNPEVLYPRSIFEKQWIDYGIYALGYSLMILKAMLCKKENVPTYVKDTNENGLLTMFSNLTDNMEEYLKRTKYIVSHMISIGIL